MKKQTFDVSKFAEVFKQPPPPSELRFWISSQTWEEMQKAYYGFIPAGDEWDQRLSETRDMLHRLIDLTWERERVLQIYRDTGIFVYNSKPSIGSLFYALNINP